MNRLNKHLYHLVTVLLMAFVAAAGILSSAAAAESPAAATSVAPVQQTKNQVVQLLAEAKVMDAARAGTIAAAPVQPDETVKGLRVSMKNGRPVFCMQPNLKASLLELAKEFAVTHPEDIAEEWFVSSVAGACAEADMLLALGEKKAAALPERTRRGLAFCMEYTVLKLLQKAPDEFAYMTDAAAPTGDTSLVIYMVVGDGHSYAEYLRERDLFSPRYSPSTVGKGGEVSIDISQLGNKDSGGVQVPAASQTKPAAAVSQKSDRLGLATYDDINSPWHKDFEDAVAALKPLSSRTDIKGFDAGLRRLLHAVSRGVRLTVHEEPYLRPFNTLTREEAAKSTRWYRGPRVTLDVTGEWVRYYTATVAPKLDAFFRSVAEKTEIYQQDCVVRKGRDGSLVLYYVDDSWQRAVRRKQGNYRLYNVTVPVNPADFDSVRENSRMKLKVMVYYLPQAFTPPYDDFNARYVYYDIYEHVYSADKQLIASWNLRYQWNVHYMHSGLGWSYAWLPDYRISIPVMQNSYFYLADADRYGGFMASFRSAEKCFPKKKKGKK